MPVYGCQRDRAYYDIELDIESTHRLLIVSCKCVTVGSKIWCVYLVVIASKSIEQYLCMYIHFGTA
jgi:hypothetical protein